MNPLEFAGEVIFVSASGVLYVFIWLLVLKTNSCRRGFIAAYSISSVAQYFLSLYFRQQPLLTNILMTIILAVGLTYFAMPLLSRLFGHWLYPRNV